MDMGEYTSEEQIKSLQSLPDNAISQRPARWLPKAILRGMAVGLLTINACTPATAREISSPTPRSEVSPIATELIPPTPTEKAISQPDYVEQAKKAGELKLDNPQQIKDFFKENTQELVLDREEKTTVTENSQIMLIPFVPLELKYISAEDPELKRLFSEGLVAKVESGRKIVSPKSGTVTLHRFSSENPFTGKFNIVAIITPSAESNIKQIIMTLRDPNAKLNLSLKEAHEVRAGDLLFEAVTPENFSNEQVGQYQFAMSIWWKDSNLLRASLDNLFQDEITGKFITTGQQSFK
jgi:hypothetical protein